MSQGLIQIKIDNELKNEFMETCESIGINATSACLIFIKKVVNEQKIPFELTANKKRLNTDTVNEKTADWVITDDCENFTAYCSNCKEIVDSRSLPSICPKCKSEMRNSLP